MLAQAGLSFDTALPFCPQMMFPCFTRPASSELSPTPLITVIATEEKTIKQSPPGNQLSVPMCVLLKHYIQLQRPNTNINQKSFWRLEESPKRQLETYREEQSWHKLSSEQMWRLHLKPGITWWTEVPDSHATHILPFVWNADLRQSLFVTVKYPREGGSRTDQPHWSMMGGSPWNITSRHRINSAFFNIRYQKYFLGFF